MTTRAQAPTGAFIGAAWAALLIGLMSYLVGLWNADWPLYQKGFYLSLIIFGLYAAVSLQKSVRDRLEGIPVTGIYFGLSWMALAIAVTLLIVGLWNADLQRVEKGFYAMSFLLALFGAVTVQKNVRDSASTEMPPLPQQY